MAVVTEQVMDDNASLWNTTPAIVTEHGNLGASITRLDELAVLQGTDTTGYAAQKLVLRKDLADKTMVVAGPLAAFARISDDLPLLEKVDITRSDIINAKDTDAQDIAQLILDETTALGPALGPVGITAGMVTDLTSAITAFTDSIPMPRAAITETEAATEAIEEEFVVMDEILTTLDELMEPFKATDPDFFNAYRNARKIVDTGVRRISLIVKCTDSISGAVVAGAEVTIVELTDSLVTTRTGNARFFSLPPGSYTVTITQPFYDPVTLENVGIFDGQTTRFDLELEKT